jgi:hypothetical protein
MTIGQKVIGLGRCVVFVSVCLSMLTGCTQSPVSQPADSKKPFVLEYVSQETAYNAFPLDTSHANSSFLPAGMDLKIWMNPNHPGFYRIPLDLDNGTNLMNYMIAVTQRPPELLYESHVIAIMWFMQWPDTFSNDLGRAGFTTSFSVGNDGLETVSFVCVGLLNAGLPGSPYLAEAISSTTVHELGHNATSFSTAGSTIKDCTSDPPQEHSGNCVMMGAAVVDGELRNVCGAFSYPHTNLFCSSCIELLKEVLSGSRKL